MKKIISLSLLIVIVHYGLAQTNFNKAKLDSFFDALESNQKFMGSVAVSENGSIIYSKSIGYADIENKIIANEKSKYRIGSISKTFTAVLILKAVETKKLNINQTIYKWFPTIKNAKNITIKHLLYHRSGIHNFTNDDAYLTWNTQSKTKKDMIEIITKGGSDFTADSMADYSNSNYLLLTYILEDIYKKSYSDLLQKFIVNPIDLTNTYVFGKINSIKNECKSYKYFNSWEIESETDYSVPLGAGAIISTPTDLTKFSDALFSGKLLTNKSLEIMKTIKDHYGIGLFQIPFYKSIGYGHTGGIDGFSSVFSHFDDKKISYALTSNGSNFENNQISIAVLSAIYNKPYDIPEFTTFNTISEDLDKYLGLYVSKQIDFNINITKNGNTLIAQGKGQPAIPLEAIEKDKFNLTLVGAKFEFNPTENTMILFQGGQEIKFIRE